MCVSEHVCTCVDGRVRDFIPLLSCLFLAQIAQEEAEEKKK